MKFAVAYKISRLLPLIVAIKVKLILLSNMEGAS